MNRKCSFIALAFAVLLAGCQQSSLQKEQAAAPGAPRLLPGLGPVHHRVSTVEPDAQKFFDQGLALIYAFNHAEAVRSFRHAATLDPKLAMAHWGAAIALGPNINAPEIDQVAAKAAFDSAQRALELAPQASQSERDYIHALSKRYSADPKADLRKHAVDYSEAMQQVMKRNPNDLHAATLCAESMMNLRPWKLYTPEGKPEPGTEEIVKILEWVLSRNPNHTGANHYYIHAVEASLTPERAMPSAKRLPKLAPGAGHLVHMPAHVYIRVGDYAAAIAANADAAKADENYFVCCGPRLKNADGFYPTLYYSHNLHFLAVCAAMLGRSSDANAAAAKLFANVDPAIDQVPLAEAFAVIPTLLAVRQGQWYEILKSPAPKENRFFSRAIYHFARGMAHANTRNTGLALQERDTFEALAGKVDPALPAGNNTAAQLVGMARHVLNAKLAAVRNDNTTARAEYEAAIKIQDGLAYDEPPPWPWPVREALGGHLLRTGDAAGAEIIFREDLKRTPNNPRSVLGLSESLKARGKHVEAQAERKRFDQAWASADLKLQVNEF